MTNYIIKKLLFLFMCKTLFIGLSLCLEKWDAKSSCQGSLSPCNASPSPSSGQETHGWSWFLTSRGSGLKVVLWNGSVVLSASCFPSQLQFPLQYNRGLGPVSGSQSGCAKKSPTCSAHNRPVTLHG